MGLFAGMKRKRDRSIACPYCMKVLNEDTVVYKCDGIGCTKEVAYKEYSGGMASKMCTEKVKREVERRMEDSADFGEFENQGANPKMLYTEARTEVCRGTLKLSCKLCGKKLPFQIFQFDRCVKICIVGQTYCGKTTYITVMPDVFQQKLSNQFYMEAMYDYDALIEELIRENTSRMQDDKSIVKASNMNLEIPYLWCVTDRMKYKMYKNGKKLKKRNLVYSLMMFDGAGRHYQANMTDVAKKYIGGSDYIFFLVDLDTFPGVQKELGRAVQGENESSTIVKNMANYLREAFGIPAGGKIDKPVAVILTKFDIIKGTSTMSEQRQVAQENNLKFCRGYMRSDMDIVDEEIRSWLESIGEKNRFLADLDVHFSRIRLFSVSSLGHEAKDDGSVGILVPHRVLDPIMWVLSEEDIVHKIEI